MAEPFGIVSGAIGIVSAFSTCVEVFEYVHLGRRFGKDYQTSQLRLTVAQVRLSRWGESVGIYDDPQLGSPSASKAELQAAKDIILQILVLFDDSNRISKKFKLKSGDDIPPAPDSDTDIAALALNNKMRSLAKKRQKSTSFVKLTSWAIHHSTALKTLIDDVVGLIDGLEQLFPPPSAVQAQLVQEEAAEAEGEEQSRALASSAKGVDDLLSKVTVSASGHQYNKVEIEAGEDGSAMNGNVYSNDYTSGDVPQVSHVYDDIKIKGTTGLRVLNGNKYGGDDFFSRK